MGHDPGAGRDMSPLELFRALLAKGVQFEIAETDAGDLCLGIAGKIPQVLAKQVERNPEALASIVLEHLPEFTPGLGDATPVLVMSVRAKDGLDARWKTEKGQVRISEVKDPDKKKRGKGNG